jgi:hypothetical protein
MGISGQYVKTFAEATHALPDGMHMNADYPFMLPKIVERTETTITIEGRGGARETLAIKRREGTEFAHLAQSSAFERIYGRPPTRFRMNPFKATESW